MSDLNSLFGKKISFASKLMRRREFNTSAGYTWKYWKEVKIKPTVGIIIGKRSLQEGYVENVGYEEGNMFVSKNRVDAFLVVADMHHNPVYIPAHEALNIKGNQK